MVEAGTRPRCCAMAIAAVSGRLKMRCMLANGANTVVTAAARAGRAAVVKNSAKPCVCVVACATFSRRWQVCRMFACCPYPVVTSTASAGDASVIEAGAKPCIGCMAHVAFRGCLWVCRMFAGGGNAVMAAAAGANNRSMIDSADTAEGDGVMTVFTSRYNSDMRRWQAGGHRVIVAGLTGCEHATMVESRASPGFCSVAVIAEVAACDMFSMFTRRATVIVAQDTLHWRTLELPANMAAGAVYKFVFTC